MASISPVASDSDPEFDFIENFLVNVLSGDDFNPLLSTLHSYRIDEDDVDGELHQLSLNFLRGRYFIFNALGNVERTNLR